MEREQRLTAFFAERLQALEAPRGPTKPEPAGPTDPVDPARAEPERERSWWRRWFG
jgi:hypothetical protein